MALTAAQEALLTDLQNNVEAPGEATVDAGQGQALERLTEITARLHHLVDELAGLNAEQSRCIAALEREVAV